MKQRMNVYQLPAGDTTLAWYAKAVLAMKSRPSTDPTSWNYQAAMHGFDAASPFWRGASPLPSPTEQNKFWNQCQHGSWFFLPWHRMYLAYFEQIVAKTIVDLGGPANWALPYWNYSDTSNPNARVMPPAFTSPAAASNGLWMPGRASNTIPSRYVTLGALNTTNYTGDGRTAPLGFGGPESPFSHNGGPHGALESLPHDMVHVSIGGAMGDPRTAGLDPIFWLHHANIDRLWQVWLNMGNRRNPSKSSWLNFDFNFHDARGMAATMKCTDVEDTKQVLSGYTYQGVPTATTNNLKNFALPENFNFSMPMEITAASDAKLTLGAVATKTSLALSPSKGRLKNFVATTESLAKTATPKTSILHFENITGKGIPPIHDVYINLEGNDKNKESHYAGSLAFFGIEQSSISSAHESGSGQHYAIDISELMNQLRSLSNWDEQKIDISIEASSKMDEDANVTIGKISLYSE